MSNRREPEQTDHVKLAQDTGVGIAVNKDGTLCTSGWPFGVTVDKGDSGQLITVARTGFVPVLVAVATGFTAGTRVAPGTGGKAVAVSGTAPQPFYGVLEEDTQSDNSLVDAWVNTLDQLHS